MIRPELHRLFATVHLVSLSVQQYYRCFNPPFQRLVVLFNENSSRREKNRSPGHLWVLPFSLVEHLANESHCNVTLVFAGWQCDDQVLLCRSFE